MLSIHLPFQVLSSTVEVLQNVRTATYVTRLNVHLRGRSLYVRIRQPLASGVAYPAGTAIFVDGFASRPTSSYHLEIVAFRVVATTATDDPRETGHVDMTGIVCNLAQNYCTLVVERSGETSWLVGIDTSLFRESVVRGLLPGTPLQVSGQIHNYDCSIDGFNNLIVFQASVICKNVPTCTSPPVMFISPLAFPPLPISEGPPHDLPLSLRQLEDFQATPVGIRPQPGPLPSDTFLVAPTNNPGALGSLPSHLDAAWSRGSTCPLNNAEGSQTSTKRRRTTHHDVRQVALSSSHSVLRQVELVVAPASWRRVGPSMIGADQDSDARRRSRQHVAHRAPWRSDLFQHFLLGLDVVREEQRLEGGGARIKRGMECMGFKPDC